MNDLKQGTVLGINQPAEREPGTTIEVNRKMEPRVFARENFSALVVVCSGCGNGIASREEIYELSEAMARRIVCVRFIRRV